MAFLSGKSKSGPDIAHCDGYAWNQRDMLGKGSYGDVYKGWRESGKREEVAVKVVRKALFRQDPKAEQNLDREIKILKRLKNCEYVVHLYHVQDMTRAGVIVLVMELCECDLDHLLKMKPFRDNDIITLLSQLGEGMKALRAHNIVHRDIKPGNILVKFHPTTGKMLLKLADFGFARVFTDESMKPLDLTSLAGTPVFMAPEALRCVFNPGVEHYDDKVDLWSIGALLYKVIVGQCGFYAQLNHILHILNKKKDAIAWEPSTAPNYGPVPKVNYVYELPSSVDDRFSPAFKQKINELLVSLLKLDPLERMTFPEFFDFVDDLMKSKVEVVNLLQGTSFKFMMDSGMTTDLLFGDIQAATGVPVESQILFSPQTELYVAANSILTQEEFNVFMNRAGGSQGHAVILFVPVSEIISEMPEPDYGPVAKLNYCVENRSICRELIVERKYAADIAHSLNALQRQIERQFSCIAEFQSFCVKQYDRLSALAAQTKLESQQILAKATLATQWLSADVSVLQQSKGSAVVDSTAVLQQFKSQVEHVEKQKSEMEAMIATIEDQMEGCENNLLQIATSDITDLMDNAKQLTKLAKNLPTTRKDFIYQSCEELFKLCKSLIVSSSERAHKQLRRLYEALYMIWMLVQQTVEVKDKGRMVEELLSQSVPKWRNTVLSSLTQASQQTSGYQQNAHEQAWGQRPTSALQQEYDRQHELLVSLEKEKMELQKKLKRTSGSSPLSPDSSGKQDVDALTSQLKSFCISAEKVSNPSGGRKTSPGSPATNRTLYPALEGGSGGFKMEETLEHLIPEAARYMNMFQDRLQGSAGVSGSWIGYEDAGVRVTLLDNYRVNDIVLFHPVKVGSSVSDVRLNLVHLHKPRPFAFLHEDCYSLFNFKIGKIADLVVGRLTKLKEEHQFQEKPQLAKALQEPDLTQSFYYVWAEPAGVDFYRNPKQQKTKESSRPHLPGRPHLPNITQGLKREQRRSGGDFV